MLISACLPWVIQECVFGVDIDPVSAELARIVLSDLTCGALSPDDLARNVIAGDTLAGDEPPALTERMAATREEEATT